MTAQPPRAIVDAAAWEQAAADLATGAGTLFGLWGDQNAAHMAILDPATPDATPDAGRIRILTHPGPRFPSVARLHPPAQRLERAAADLYGLVPEGAEDTRPWLDHGAWGLSHPLGTPGPAAAAPYPFLAVEGDSLHETPVGPVHAGVIEPGHFRFTAQGETVVRLEERLGYAHKGVDGLMQGAALGRAAALAGRVSGDSTVAYAYAFALAAEAALGVAPPPRASHLRALMAELERLANHLGDVGAICNDAAFAMMPAQTGVLRERVLRACDAAFGHRLMRDRILPGGVAADLTAAGADAIRAAATDIAARLPAILRLYDGTASLLDRTVGTGRLDPALAARFGAGGFVGRASGRDFDARRDLAYAPYDSLGFPVALRRDGDVNARIWIRLDEIAASLGLVAHLLDTLPPGPFQTDLAPTGPAEGLGVVEGFRGDVLAWLALDADGRVRRCWLRDPSWLQWPLLEAVIEGNIIADFPLCNKSFNCSYSGHDL